MLTGLWGIGLWGILRSHQLIQTPVIETVSGLYASGTPRQLACVDPRTAGLYNIGRWWLR